MGCRPPILIVPIPTLILNMTPHLWIGNFWLNSRLYSNTTLIYYESVSNLSLPSLCVRNHFLRVRCCGPRVSMPRFVRAYGCVGSVCLCICVFVCVGLCMARCVCVCVMVCVCERVRIWKIYSLGSFFTILKLLFCVTKQTIYTFAIFELLDGPWHDIKALFYLLS